MLSPEERRERLRNRTQSTVEQGSEKIEGARKLKVPFDLSKAGQEVVFYKQKADPRQPNMIDIVPFIITREEYLRFREFTGATPDRMLGDLEYKVEVSVHDNCGINQEPMLCRREIFGEKCERCEEMFAEYRKRHEAPQDFNKELAKSLQPVWRTAYKVYDYCDPDYTGFKLWICAYEHFEKMLKIEAQNSPDGLVVFSDPGTDQGRIVQFRAFEEKTGGSGKYNKPSAPTFIKRDPQSPAYSEEDLQALPLDQMLIIHSYEEATDLHYCTPPSSSSRQDDRPSESSSEPPRRQASPQRQPVREQPQRSQNPCPAGGVIGRDLQKHNECNEVCDDETYRRCEAEYDRLSDQAPPQETEPVQEPQREESPARRSAPTGNPQSAPPQRRAPAGGSTSASTEQTAPMRRGRR